MKRLFCLLMVLVIAMSLAVPAAAADTFVPSITYKDGPDINTATMDGGDVKGCLVVTSISKAKNKSTDITQDDRDLLLDVYTKLNSGEMKLPIENDKYVIRELVDVSFMYNNCRTPHEHEEWLKKDNTTVTIDFKLGVKSSADVLVLVYVDNKWVPAEKVTNRGNGNVTVVFEEICPVAFCVDTDSQVTPPKTGDTAGQRIFLWGSVMAGSVAALLILLVVFKRSGDEEEK
ncbi:MAG: hypothetical protein IKK17_02405 [Oscillospiraceae bacterium]|nr:hypothetical protein [Oscillospiraceae bacterium]